MLIIVQHNEEFANPRFEEKNLCLCKTAVDDINTSCTGLMRVALCSLFNETFDAVQVAPVKVGFIQSSDI